MPKRRFRDVVDEVVLLAVARRQEEQADDGVAYKFDIEHLLESQEKARKRRPRHWALRDYLEELSAEEALALEALMYSGRDRREFRSMLDEVLDKLGHERDDAVRTLLEKVQLDEYLSAGLDLARKNHLDVDSLPGMRKVTE